MSRPNKQHSHKPATLLTLLIHYFSIYVLLMVPYRLWFKFKVEGKENIPKHKPYLVASNHVSYFDPTFVSLALKTHICYLGKEELFTKPPFKHITNIFGGISVKREKFEPSAVKTIKKMLHKGWKICIFPEGTISPVKNEFLKPHKGMGYIAKLAKSDILPVSITGYENKKGNIVVKIGTPISYKLSIEEIMEHWSEQTSIMTGFCQSSEQVTYVTEEKEALVPA